ncbi:hypothetical protein CSOJ01_13855 [Colletotrichum sojae]|uniref:Uncharacterized protein n=1 Tax=Colletotrichum sojae TaxID=2175907 RepID=A0A8H6MKU7_9PEZI|nr:hypothetical protein CSOJ01_13855 [Colletotrichum sojae]
MKAKQEAKREAESYPAPLTPGHQMGWLHSEGRFFKCDHGGPAELAPVAIGPRAELVSQALLREGRDDFRHETFLQLFDESIATYMLSSSS